LVRASRYTTRQALIYYLLSIPAIVLELVFSLAIASNPQEVLPQVAAYGSTLSLFVQIVPWAVLLLSAYAIVSFRPSTLIVLLTVSFFISATVTTGMNFFGYTIALPQAVSLVIISTFTALVGFSYSRGAKILKGRELRTESGGPVGYQVLSIGVEVVLPLLAALGLVLFVGAVVAAIKAQAALLPQPLSTLSSLYLQSQAGLVFTTILIAGATIWVLRQMVEPIIVYYTINAGDGVKILLSDIDDITKKVWQGSKVSFRGSALWLFLGVFSIAAALVYLEGSLGTQAIYNGLLAILGQQKPATTPFELAFQQSVKDTMIRTDELVLRAEDFIRTIIQLLWG
jgi:hypothetical protein